MAILLVVLFHAGVPGLTGGYVGVDVFFVISGFVITGVLLRERSSTGTNSLLAFYGRRARRIIPAATLVIIVTVLAAHWYLDSLSANQTAADGQWASVFLANYHFAASGTNYLASLQPPSPLQNFWSLAVEEQFYIVYPTIFLITATVLTRLSLRFRLGIVLGLGVVASYTLSIVLTSTNPQSAFFSPFTRAWELALGGLVAVSNDRLRQLPQWIAAGISWLGLLGILVAATLFTSATSYPGTLVAIPVISAALVIAGGAAQPKCGAESCLRMRPLQWLGLISYSLYLWHWPILTIAAQSQGKTSLPVGESLLWILLAVVLAIGTYLVIENPIRHSKYLISKRAASVGMGACLVLSGLVVSTAVHKNVKTALLGNVTTAAGNTPCSLPAPVDIAALKTAYEKTSGHRKHASTQKLRVLVIGDSTSCTMLPGLEAVAPSYGVQIGNGAIIGCGVVSGQVEPVYYDGLNVAAFTKSCQRRANHVEATAIRREKPNVILWGSTEERESIIVNTAKGPKILLNSSAQWKSVMLHRMDTRVEQLLATGAKVFLLLQPPFVNNGRPTRPTSSDKAFEQLNGLLRDIAASHPGRVRLIDLASRVCPSGPPCQSVIDGVWVRPDNAHYGATSSLWVAEWLIPKILAGGNSS